jgi:hypothetical protein
LGGSKWTQHTSKAKWKAHLERIGETEVRNDLNFRSGVQVGITDELMRQYAFRWLREKAQDRDNRERSTHLFVQWTFWAAVAAVLIGIVGVLVTIFAKH